MFRSCKHSFFILFVLFFTNLSFSQTNDNKSDKNWFILPLIYYTTDTSLGFGLTGGLYLNQAGQQKVNTLTAMMLYTLRGQFQFQSSPEFYWDQEKWKFNAFVQAYYYPTQYYGIGSKQSTNDLVKYTPRRFTGLFQIHRRVSALYLAYQTRFSHHKIITISDAFGISPELMEKGLFTWGNGLNLSWDTRDNNIFPYQGAYFELSWMHYNQALGSQLDFDQLDLDLKYYHHFQKIDTILASRFSVIQIVGEVPFVYKPSFGGYKLFRGYPEGRFTDDFVAITQFELRRYLWRFIGAVAFFDLGYIAPGLTAIDLNDIKFSGGLGLRFRLNEKNANLRADFAFSGEGDFGFYIIGKEAF